MHLYALQTMHDLCKSVESFLLDLSCGVQIMFLEKQFTSAVYGSIGCCSHTYIKYLHSLHLRKVTCSTVCSLGLAGVCMEKSLLSQQLLTGIGFFIHTFSG